MRYADRFLNSLMYPHKMTARAELFYGGGKVGDFDLSSSAGSVTADRGAIARRTFQATVDPAMTPKSLTDRLTPFGSQIKVFRGIEYNDNTVEEFPVFFGRIDSLDFSRDSMVIRASDRASDVADTRFEVPRTATSGIQVRNQMRDLITEAVVGATVNITTPNTSIITTPAVWDRDRTEALDNLGYTIGAEWYAMPDETWAISPLPGSVASGPAIWIIDSGDIGVAVSRQTNLDRGNVFNAVVVNGEPPTGLPPAYGVARDTNGASPTVWGGAYGKIPMFFSSQFITTNAQAVNTAKALLAESVAGTRAVTVNCIPNPKLRLADVVMIATDQTGFDGLYYVQSFTLPIDPVTPMSIVCNVALDPGIFGDLVDAPIAFAEGISWP